MPICLRLLVQFIRRAASRADWTAGSSRAIRTPMMAMTTSNSMSVKPPGLRPGWARRMRDLLPGAGTPRTIRERIARPPGAGPRDEDERDLRRDDRGGRGRRG